MVAQIGRNYIAARPSKLISRIISYALFEGRPLTTSGQWINPFLFAHFALEKRFPQVKSVRQPLFILGTGRSGTTILGVVLSMHRDVGFLNEPKALWHSIYPDEDLVGSYSRGLARYRLDASDADKLVRKNGRRLFGAYLAATFSTRVVDKYPELIFRVPFVKAIFPDAKFLFLVRNGWDTCHSIEGWSDRFGKKVKQETHDWWGADRRKWNLILDQLVPEHAELARHVNEMRNWSNQTDMAAVEWMLSMQEGLRLQLEYPDDILRVNYEFLCEHPHAELTRIAEFAGLSCDDEVFFQYGKETLKPAAPKKLLELHPMINDAFEDMMHKLGYDK